MKDFILDDADLPLLEYRSGVEFKNFFSNVSQKRSSQRCIAKFK